MYGQLFYGSSSAQRSFGWSEFSIVSYNVLAQYLIAENMYLYPHCRREHLDWNYRCWKLLDEITTLNPDVCTIIHCLLVFDFFLYNNMYYLVQG